MKSQIDYEYKSINTKDICIDPLYQRDLDNSKVQKIVKNFNPYLVNPIKVSFRDGRYYVFDGQHTRAALIRKNRGHDCLVECKVFYGLTRNDEMELFIVSGFGELFMMYGNRLDVKRLIRKLSEIGYTEIIREGKIGNAPGGKKYARIILRQYNRGLRNGMLEDKF